MMDKINQYKGMFAVKYNYGVTSCPAIIDFREFKEGKGVNIFIEKQIGSTQG